MQFYSTGNQHLSLTHEIWKLCDADITAYPLADVARRVNAGLEEAVAEIINADGAHEWDDTNHTDLPVETFTLVEGQESYSFAEEYLKIKRMKVKDLNGNWHPLEQLDQEDIKASGIAIEELYSASGFPEYYDLMGDSFRLYPAPAAASMTLASGLKVEYSRTIDFLTGSDTSQEPGIPSLFHIYLAFYAAIPYCMTYHKDRVSLYQIKWQEGIKKIKEHFGKRNPDHKQVMTMAYTNPL